MQSITLSNGNHATIVGRLHPIPNSKRLLVFCHGFRTTHEHPALQAISKGLHAKGHAVFTFNFSDDTGFDIAQHVKDLSVIAKHFRDYTEIILLAGSLGALSASIAATTEPRITGLVTVNGFFGASKLRGRMRLVYRGFRALALIKSSYRKIWRYYKTHFKPDHITAPVLVIHSRTDETVSFAQSEHFFANLKCHKKFVELTRTNHDLTETDEIGFIIKTIDGWIAATFVKTY